jgi:hypothetical protein
MSLGSVKRRQTWRYLRTGTWNILKLYRPGASNILEQEMEKVHMDLVALQEIKWLGNGTLEKKEITLVKPEGRRRVGRPNLRWMDGVMRDAERLRVRNCRIKDKDRDGWRRLESAKTLHGL